MTATKQNDAKQSVVTCHSKCVCVRLSVCVIKSRKSNFSKTFLVQNADEPPPAYFFCSEKPKVTKTLGGQSYPKVSNTQASAALDDGQHSIIIIVVLCVPVPFAFARRVPSCTPHQLPSHWLGFGSPPTHSSSSSSFSRIFYHRDRHTAVTRDCLQARPDCTVVHRRSQ